MNFTVGEPMKQIVDTLINDSIEVTHQVRSEPFTDMVISHYHPSFEIYYLMEGERIYFVKDQSYSIQKGDFVFIPPNIIHKTLTNESYAHERILISFDHSFLSSITEHIPAIDWYNAFDQDNPVITVQLSKRGVLQDIMLKILTIYEENEPDSRAYLQVLVLELLLLINRYKDKKHNLKADGQSPTDKRVFDIVRYINANYMNQLSLRSISQLFFISPYYLSHIFKDSTGFSFCDYLIQLRILEAKKLLGQTKYTMTHIAELVGFESSTHFGRTFKKVTGLTPRDYRKSIVFN